MHKVIIIGSGPAGYTAALYTARAGLEPILLAGITPGGALMNTTLVENFPGFINGIQGPELMTIMRNQAINFGTKIFNNDVIDIKIKNNIKIITTDDNKEYIAQSIIIATGSSYRKLNIDGETKLSGYGVSWCATCDGFFFKNKNIIVVGGGDSALEEALFLTRFANSVTIIHRRNKFRASKIMQKRVFNNTKIKILWDTTIKEIKGESNVTAVDLIHNTHNTIHHMDIDGIFIAIGHIPNSHIFKAYINTSSTGHIITNNNTCATNVQGIFAAGDVVDPLYMQAITAAGNGCAAALDVEKYLSSLEV